METVESKVIHRIGTGFISLEAYECTDKNGNIHQLGKGEVKLLSFLIENNGVPVSRESIAEQLGRDYVTRTIDNMICKFRKLFEKDTQYFYSIRGLGYKLKF